MIFDLLYLDGRSTMELPYRERRALLEELELRGPAWQTPAYHVGEGRELLAASAEQRSGGRASPSAWTRPTGPGKRSGRVVEDQERQPPGARDRRVAAGQGRRAGQLGALLVGYYEQTSDGGSRGAALRRARRHRLRRARARAPGAASSPRARATPVRSPRAESSRRAGPASCEPELVAEIEFSQWTRDRILRHSSYKGLRDGQAGGGGRDWRARSRGPRIERKRSQRKSRTSRHLAETESAAGAEQPYEIAARNQARHRDRGRGTRR